MGINIIRMRDFANLFLATYVSYRGSDDTDEIYISKHYEEIIEFIANDYINRGMITNPNLLFDGNFDIDEFKCMLFSSSLRKKQDEKPYDEEMKCIIIYVDRKDAKSCVEKFEEKDRNLMASMLSYYYEKEKEYDLKDISDAKKYNLDMKSDD